MKRGVKQLCQAAVELVRSTDDAGCCVQHMLKKIIGGLDDRASTVLQQSTRDETKACTSVFADAVSSER